MYVVPLPSDRWQTTMSVSGSFTEGFSFGDRVVVPFGDLTQVYVRDHRASQPERTGHTRNVVGNHVGAHHGREVQYLLAMFTSCPVSLTFDLCLSPPLVYSVALFLLPILSIYILIRMLHLSW